jgi:diguanylate cyclase (GGDEF)-like protein
MANVGVTRSDPPTATDARERRVRPNRRRARSLRTRWNRAFTGLILVMTVGALVSVGSTRVLVGSYRGTAERLQTEAALLADLRTDIVPHALAASAPLADDAARLAQEALETRIRAAFATDVSYAPAGRAVLHRAYARWDALVRALRTIDPGSTPAGRAKVVYDSVAIEVPKVLALLDVVGATSRAAARADLAKNADVERAAYAGLVAFGLLALALMVRLARRLSTEVLRPVGALRASANLLARGDVAQRVSVGRDDELGDLARSFNAMAEAVADSQRVLTRQANHDSLTGLANRAAFDARVREALASQDRREGTQAVLFVDLDDFKDVNDVLGHAAGDELLRAVGVRLGEVVRPGDVVARLGGDEFALLLDGIPDGLAAYALANRAAAALSTPVEIQGSWVAINASIGLAMRRDGSDLDTLMREADIAMYSAKSHGKNRVERYDAMLHAAVLDQQSLKQDVTGVAARGELVLDYQPIVDLNDGTLLGLEALVRWQHPTRGLLPPSAFIQLAEDTGAIAEIGTWVLTTAAAQVRSWQRRYRRPDLWLSVNVSVRQLEEQGFVGLVTDVLSSTGLEARCLVVEITESVLADPAGGAAVALEALRRNGVRVALDDFGTGYSSLGYLRQLPVDVLKIDRSFVSGPHARGRGEALLEAIVGLGRHLDLDVIPEGIEHPTELRRLQALGCRTGQGFLFSRPVPAGDIDAWLASVAPTLDFELHQVATRFAVRTP